MGYFFPLLGIISSLAMLKYREQLGNFMGEADWMRYVGGVYNFVIVLAIFVFFWSIASLTGTTEYLFKPFLYLLPGGVRNSGDQLPGVQ